MKTIYIILTLLTTVLFYQSSEGQTLDPKLIDNLYCFDSIQVRFLVKEVHNGPLKDSLINEQAEKITDLETIILKKDTIISSKDVLIRNDSIHKEEFRDVLKHSNEKSDIVITRQKKRIRKGVIVIVAEFALIVLLLLR